MKEELTFGQKAVGLRFNPSGDDEVANCKQGFATEIDRLIEVGEQSSSVEQTLLSLEAIKHIQTAQMWAVKALTWKD